jgi:RING finger protein 113A
VSSRKGKLDDMDGGVTEEEAKLLEKIPFACVICKKPYTKPVVTACGHYFCEACALQKFRKSPNCQTCGAGTGGVFNGARNLQKLLDKKRIREEKLQEKELEEFESDDE